MPGRVTNFFRSSNEGVNHAKKTTAPSRGSPARTWSYASSLDSQDSTPNSSSTHLPLAVRMSDPAKEKDHPRVSFPSLHLGGSKAFKETSHHHSGASLDWKIESPPAVMHGDAESSTGALVSGQLFLDVKDVVLDVESFDAKLEIVVTQKRPYTSHCADCTTQKTEIQSWHFLREPTSLSKGEHAFPFSVLLEGHLPASSDNMLVSVRYNFTAEAKPRVGPAIKFAKNILVKRSLPEPELPHHSVRIFPPTNITASVHYPQVIYPLGVQKLDLRLDGIVKTNSDANTVEYWKLKRLSWKLEENMTTVAPACERHAPKNADSDSNAKKGVKRTETRVIGSADLSSGWKANYGPDGTIEAEIEYQCNPAMNPVCNVKSRDGTEITHQLVVEMVVVQEWAPVKQPRQINPTGVARILRMHFAHTLTERGGMGVSWDNEAPPIYQDVPPSPPSYICDIPYDSIEDITLSNRTSEESHRTSSS